MDFDYSPWPDMNSFLDFLEMDMEEPTPELDMSGAIGSVMGESLSNANVSAMAGAAPAAPAMPEAPPQPEAAPVAAPAAPKPPAGAGAPDGLSQITSTQPAQQDSRADSLFKD